MKNIYLTLLLACTATFAQTRLISHKSHSGSAATFNMTLENSLFDISESNFGLPDKQMSFTIDSIILLPDDKVIVVSSEKDVYRHYAKSAISFKPGRDTLHNHPLLSQKHKKDSILRVLQPYDAKHAPVLINYDNNKTKKNSLPVVPNDNGTPNMPLMIAALALISVLFGSVFFALHKIKATRLA